MDTSRDSLLCAEATAVSLASGLSVVRQACLLPSDADISDTSPSNPHFPPLVIILCRKPFTAMDMTSQDYITSIAALNSTQLTGDALHRANNSRNSTMEDMHVYLQRLGLAESLPKLPILHVAGSKGKGSTCAFAEAVLCKQGVRTALFTSPHLVRVNERIRLNGEPLTDKHWSLHFWTVWNRLQDRRSTGLQRSADASLLKSSSSSAASGASTTRIAEPDVTPGYFRLLTLLAFWVAISEQVDVLILEVGVGGRFDATNVVPKPVACAITTLDLEHTDLLGSTIEEIAWEKGGIIKPGTPCFLEPQPTEYQSSILRVLRACVLDAPGAELHVVKPLPGDVKLGIAGDFQAMNAALALALVREYNVYSRRCSRSTIEGSVAEGIVQDPRAESCVAWVDVYPYISTDRPAVSQGLQSCTWPGRCQRLDWGSSCSFFIDGAHTVESIQSAVAWFKGQALSRPRALLFYCGEGKTAPELLAHLVTLGSATSSTPYSKFSLAFFCPVDCAKPTLSRARSARALLLEHNEGFSHARQLDQSVLHALCDAVENMNAQNSSNTPSLLWQQTLRDTWRILSAYHLFAQDKESENESISGIGFSDSNAEVREGGHGGRVTKWSSWIEQADQQTRSKVFPSVAAAMGEIDAMTNIEPFDVLVTGSLYLVGNVLNYVERIPSPFSNSKKK